MNVWFWSVWAIKHTINTKDLTNRTWGYRSIVMSQKNTIKHFFTIVISTEVFMCCTVEHHWGRSRCGAFILIDAHKSGDLIWYIYFKSIFSAISRSQYFFLILCIFIPFNCRIMTPGLSHILLTVLVQLSLNKSFKIPLYSNTKHKESTDRRSSVNAVEKPQLASSERSWEVRKKRGI